MYISSYIHIHKYIYIYMYVSRTGVGKGRLFVKKNFVQNLFNWIRIFICTYFEYVYIPIYICLYLYIFVYIYMHSALLSIFIYTYIYTYIHIYICVYICVYKTHPHTTHTQTYTHISNLTNPRRTVANKKCKKV